MKHFTTMTQEEFDTLSKEERREVLRQISRAKQQAAIEAAQKKNPALSAGREIHAASSNTVSENERR